MFWRASKQSIQGSVISAIAIVEAHRFASVAFPVVGAGSGGYSEASAIDLMQDSLTNIAGQAAVTPRGFFGVSGIKPDLGRMLGIQPQRASRCGQA